MSEMPTITINIDKRCKRCGKTGACDNGLCLDCVLKALKNGELEHILNPLRINPQIKHPSSEKGNHEMSIGLVWFDNDKKKTLAEKIRAAAERYLTAHGVVANEAHIHAANYDPAAIVDGIKIVIDPLMLKNHIWVIKEKEQNNV